MSVFDDEKSDGNHPLIDPGHYWRPGNSLGDKAQRFCAYGNYAGVDNRMEIENRSAIEQNRAVNPGYDQYADPQYQMDPRYLPVDPLDGAAMAHDHAYFDKLGFDNPKTGEHARNMFGWDGLNRVRDADRNIADDTLGELNRKPDKYSALTHMKGEGLNGFFGARANGVDAANWAGGRLDDASAGMSDFIGNVGNAHSPTDVAAGVGHGIMDAGHWAAQTGHEAAGGISQGAHDFGQLGAFGKLSSLAGYANVALAGAGHLVGDLVSSAVMGVGHSAEGLFDRFAH